MELERLYSQQLELARRLVLEPLKEEPQLVAGADCAFVEDRVIAVATLFRLPELRMVGSTSAVLKTAIPYVPGLLCFREGPALIAAIKKLEPKPQVVLLDGQGIAHPRKAGVATYVGVELGLPTIGCAKSRLTGSSSEPPDVRFAHPPLVCDGATVGAVLRTKKGVKPIFISPGHRITCQDAIKVVISCTAGYRLPEPVRIADLMTKRLRKALSARVDHR